jgi:hypothetical protein
MFRLYKLAIIKTQTNIQAKHWALRWVAGSFTLYDMYIYVYIIIKYKNYS